MSAQQRVLVVNQNTRRESGHKAQRNLIQAAKAVSELVRSTLGPSAMLKMIMDPMGGIVLTNDGNSILREVDVVHPAAKHMMELSRILDEEVGDGTTSVVILTGELLALAEPLVEKGVHPLDIIRGYNKALEDIVKYIHAQPISHALDTDNEEDFEVVVRSCLGTKVSSKHHDVICPMVIQAVKRIHEVSEQGTQYVDIKRLIKIEKIPGGTFLDSELLRGVMINKDLVHPRMRRTIDNPRVILLDTPLEYKKPETSFTMEVQNDEDFEKLILMEEEYVRSLCNSIIKHKPDIVVTEKGVSDLAAHFLYRANISVLRRVRKTDNIRIGKACGAKINSSVEEIEADSVGTKCGLFTIKRIGDESFSYFIKCEDSKACTIVLRGASKDALNEAERNLRDALCVARNVLMDPRVVYGAGAVEFELSKSLLERSSEIEGLQQIAYRKVSCALEVIPRTLAENCGGRVVGILTELRSRHNAPNGNCWGIDGITGKIIDVQSANILEPVAVKRQVYKTAIEAASTMLRIDDVISGMRGKGDQSASKHASPEE